MERLTRRAFTTLLITSAVLPASRDSTAEIPQTEQRTSNPTIPDSIAGHFFTPEEKRLVARFLSKHEESLSSLRANDLPNSLSPAFCYSSELSTRP